MMQDVELIRENTTLDDMINFLAGSLATVTSPISGGFYLSQIVQENYEYIGPLVAVPSGLFVVGQYFFSRFERKD